MKHFKHIIWLLMLAFIYACIEPFDFTVGESAEKILVVEGGISNLTKAHEIKLSYTYALDADSANVLSDAQLSIISERGSTESLSSQGNGLYTTRENFAGQVGESYKLVIVTGDKRYESSFEELLGAPEVDAVYGKYVQLPNEETNEVEGGIQFFIDTHDQSLMTSYYRYEWEDVYQIIVPFPSYYEAQIVDDSAILVRRTEPVGICYGYDTSSSLIIGTAINSFENQLKEFPIRFISGTSQKLRNRIGILTKQYAVSENAYVYYRKLRENRDASGSLFDIQAGTVVGNMVSTTDDGEVVLGFFEVSGVSERRDFFRPSDFSEQGYRAPGFRYTCELDSALNLDSAANLILTTDYMQVGEILVAFIPGSVDSAYMHNRNCSSCDWYADTNQPEYWNE